MKGELNAFSQFSEGVTSLDSSLDLSAYSSLSVCYLLKFHLFLKMLSDEGEGILKGTFKLPSEVPLETFDLTLKGHGDLDEQFWS